MFLVPHLGQNMGSPSFRFSHVKARPKTTKLVAQHIPKTISPARAEARPRCRRPLAHVDNKKGAVPSKRRHQQGLIQLRTPYEQGRPRRGARGPAPFARRDPREARERRVNGAGPLAPRRGSARSSCSPYGRIWKPSEAISLAKPRTVSSETSYGSRPMFLRLARMLLGTVMIWQPQASAW